MRGDELFQREGQHLRDNLEVGADPRRLLEVE